MNQKEDFIDLFKMVKCRICGMDCNYLGWAKHVNKHKREFCRAIGRFEGEAWKVNWEDVVKFFNPKKAKNNKLKKWL